jgi:hypothetical protein
MVITVEFWQLVGLLVTFFGACAAAGRALLSQTQKHIDGRFEGVGVRLDGIEQAAREEVNQWRRVEREVMALKADLPMRFVMREDYIRGQSVLETKIDGLAMKLENAQLRGLVGAQPGVQKNEH